MHISSGLPQGFNPQAYDMVVVGAGYAGSVCARRLAETSGFRVCVLERRNHIAGNAWTMRGSSSTSTGRTSTTPPPSA